MRLSDAKLLNWDFNGLCGIALELPRNKVDVCIAARLPQCSSRLSTFSHPPPTKAFNRFAIVIIEVM
jgi:hypothetical protein